MDVCGKSAACHLKGLSVTQPPDTMRAFCGGGQSVCGGGVANEIVPAYTVRAALCACYVAHGGRVVVSDSR